MGPELPTPWLGPTQTATSLAVAITFGPHASALSALKKVLSPTCPLNGSFQSPNCPLKAFFHTPNGIFLFANGQMAVDFSSPGRDRETERGSHRCSEDWPSVCRGTPTPGRRKRWPYAAGLLSSTCTTSATSKLRTFQPGRSEEHSPSAVGEICRGRKRKENLVLISEFAYCAGLARE